MKKAIFVLSFTFLFSFSPKAQNSETAFTKSYAFEYDTQYAKAISALLEAGEDTYEINLRLGWLYYSSKDYVKSETYYKKAIGMEPGSIEARFGIALPLSAQGNWNDVLSTYMEIVKLDPNNSIANYRISSIYYNRKDYVNSTAYILKVIKTYPFDYDSNLLYGKVLMAQNKNADAKKFLTRAIEYNPQSDDAKALLKKL